MSTTEATLYVERGDDELALTVRGTVTPYVRARLHGPPEMCSPSEGGEAEIDAVLLDGLPWGGTLTEAEEEEARDKLAEAAGEDAAGRYDDYCDRAYDEMREREWEVA